MNIKLALTALFCGVVMSCSVSEGQLLDRMLSKAGCSVCDCAPAPITSCSEEVSCGCATESCGPGLLDKLKARFASADAGCGCEAPVADCGCEVAPAPVDDCGCDVAPACGNRGPGLLDKLKARLSSVGNGCGCSAPAAGCGCEEAPVVFSAPIVESCGCEAPAISTCGGPGILDKLKARLSSIGSGSGCDAPVAVDCGCEPAPAPITDCGCEVDPCGGIQRPALLQNVKSRFSGIGCRTPALASAGCEPTPAPVVDSCGCEPAAAPACGCDNGPGLLDKLKSRLSSVGGGGCGCAAAPVADDCGCSAPVAAPCVTPAVAAAPACEAAPVADCGCDAAPACGSKRPRLSLLDRLRGNRIPRDRSGRVIGSGCNDGCNPPCPNTSPCDTGCGCGGAVMAAPMAGGVIYGEPTAATVTEEVNVESAPVVTEPIQPSPADVIEEAAPAAEKAEDTPAVDPNAFIIRRGKVNG